MVASYVAYSKKLDFLCADRTFSSFGEIALFRLGLRFCRLFRLVTDWDYLVVPAYMEAKCYKVITNDIKDEVIPYLASIKNGVCRLFGGNREI